jgi:hypothetical protein
MALDAAIVLGRVIPTLAMVGASGLIVAAIGAHAIGLGIAATALVVCAVGLGVVILLSVVSDLTQIWRGWVRGDDFVVLYSRGWSFHRTVWSGIRRTDRLYRRRLGYQQIGQILEADRRASSD